MYGAGWWVHGAGWGPWEVLNYRGWGSMGVGSMGAWCWVGSMGAWCRVGSMGGAEL